MCALLGEASQDIIMLPLSNYIPAEFREESGRIIEALIIYGVLLGVMPVRHANGASIYLEWNMSVHSVPGIRLSIVTDISQRLEIEREREALLMRVRAARADAERADQQKGE